MSDRADLERQLIEAKTEALEKFQSLDSSQALYDCRTNYLGKKGVVKGILRGVGRLDPADRPVIGQIANEVADELEEAYQGFLSTVKARESASRLEQDAIDTTFPGVWGRKGGRHPVSMVREDIEDLFYSMGFDIAEGPEIENDYYNFEALNIPADHPARDMQDTFYMKNGHVLRTHTSPVQIHYMETHEPPLRMICPGRVYRYDSDSTHSPMFTQIECLVVDENITFRDLKGMLELVIHKLFAPDTKIRFRPSFFPFTEPSAEVDIWDDTKGWMEVLGCGMVNPAVFESVGYDPEKYSGFAFGLGIERLTMLRYGIKDIRLLYENDIRFLQQFR